MKFIIITICAGLSFNCYSQLCNGNLGQNIFVNGNFGAGSDNILQTDPQIAPGYQYVMEDPVQDGQYTITNGLSNWTSINGWGWIRSDDASLNPEGYMMVVNASYDPGLFYEEQVSGLCENSIFEFSAEIINLVESGSNKIKPNVSFLIDGQVVYSTGDIPENESWIKYGFTFNTVPGQTSITLALRNNAPGGIGNDLALDNISFRACGPESRILPVQTEFICEDSALITLDATINGNQYDDPHYQWQESASYGVSWSDLPGDTFPTFEHHNNNGGYYYYRYLLANSKQNLLNNKCRIISNTKIIRVTPELNYFHDTICEGDIYNFDGKQLTDSGLYIDSTVTKAGCDSIAFLHLEVVEDKGIKTEYVTEDPTCSGYEDGTVNFINVFNGYPPYQIVFQDYAINTQRITGLGAGNYNILVKDRFECDADTTIQILDREEFDLDLGDDKSIELGESLFLKPTANYSIENYFWQPHNISNCSRNCDSLIIYPVYTGHIVLTALNEKSCIAVDTVFIEVIENRDVLIPNIITPNGDGFNDFFAIKSKLNNLNQVSILKIYNRWGDLVYESKNINKENFDKIWTAESEGKKLPAGVYFYKMTLQYVDSKSQNFQGSLNIIY